VSTSVMEMLAHWRNTDPRVGPAPSPGATETSGSEAVDRAVQAYRALHGHDPARVLSAPVRCATRVTASLGPTVAIEYRDDGKVQRLDFGRDMPELAFDEVNRSLHLVFGAALLESQDGQWIARGQQVQVTADEVARAEAAYRDTHGGRAPNRLLWGAVPCARGPVVAIGPVVAVEYLADKGDGLYTYRHVFEAEPPLLAVDLETNSLQLVLGSYTVTSHGVEDTMEPSDYAIIANPANPPRELGLHPHLRRSMRANPGDDSAVSASVMLLTVGVGVGGALLIKWGADKVAAWRQWNGKVGAYLTVGAAAVVGIVTYMKYPTIGTGIVVAGTVLGLSDWLTLERQGAAAGLPAPAAAPELQTGPVFSPYVPAQ